MDMSNDSRLRQYGSLVLSGLMMLAIVGISVFMVSIGVLGLGYALSSVSEMLLHEQTMGMFQYVLIVLAVVCIAGLGVPILLLARNIQRTTENFSLLQFDEDVEEEDEEGEEPEDERDESEELNEFLRKLHKTRNIGPFIPSPKTMDDLCPCGSGLKYKDCCGKYWM